MKELYARKHTVRQPYMGLTFEVTASAFWSIENQKRLGKQWRTWKWARIALFMNSLRLCITKIWHDDAWSDYVYWQTQNKKTLRRINQLIKETKHDKRRHSYDCVNHLFGGIFPYKRAGY
jgi:hypothetical protein